MEITSNKQGWEENYHSRGKFTFLSYADIGFGVHFSATPGSHRKILEGKKVF